MYNKFGIWTHLHQKSIASWFYDKKNYHGVNVISLTFDMRIVGSMVISLTFDMRIVGSMGWSLYKEVLIIRIMIK